MNPEAERLVKRLQDEGLRTQQFFNTLRASDWQQKIYTTGTMWRTPQLLAHFVSTETAIQRLLKDILGGGKGVPPEFDIDEFNEDQVSSLADRSLHDLLEEFSSARKETIALVRKLSVEQFALVGGHPWFGPTEIRKIIKLLYRHNMIHQRDIRKALDAGSPVVHRDVTPPSRSGDAGTR